MSTTPMQHVISALENKARIVTSTNRLAYEVKAAFNAAQITQGKTVWESPVVSTWEVWMRQFWTEQNALHPKKHSAHCLSDQQTEQLLANIIETDLAQTHKEKLAALWNIPASAKTALKAWQLCHQWQISFKSLLNAEHEDHAKFGHWANTLFAHLRHKNWISPAQIPDALLSANIKWKTQADVLMFGFDDFNAQQKRFMRGFIEKGGTLETRAAFSTQNTKAISTMQATRYCFEDSYAEWQQIAAWARKKLLAQADLKLGIITPNIESIRQTARFALRQQLTPAYFQHALADPFHFSQGSPLAQAPLIKSALSCLDLLQALNFEQTSALFLNSDWGSPAEHTYRADVLNKLPQKIAYRFDLFELIRALKFCHREQNDRATAFIQKLALIQDLKSKNRNKEQALCVWRDVFIQCLSALEWAANDLDSEAFQTRTAWDNALHTWSKLDLICQPITLSKALQSLKQHCQKEPFQAQAALNTPIQIMGVLEASGIEFDAVWLSGFDEQAWPGKQYSAGNANPFIPIQTQIKAGIPDASAALQAQKAQNKTHELLALCNEIHISHAQTAEDIRLDISPLLSDVPLIAADPSSLGKAFELHHLIREAGSTLEHSEDNIGLALDGAQARGGTGLIAAQSQCPFKAYTRYRLNIREDSAPEAGMDNLQLGSEMHETLASIWGSLKTSNALHEIIKQDALDDLIDAHSKPIIEKFTRNSGLGEGYLKMEMRRLNAMIKQWLEIDASREPFEVLMIEEKFTHPLKGLALNFTIDRVDKININGSPALAIMDYKSGQTNFIEWAGERLKAPQIPLYYLALASQDNLPETTALAFAQVKQDDCKYVGLSQDQGALPEVNPLDKHKTSKLGKEALAWADLMPLWRGRLDHLAEEIQQGIAHVDPRDCDYCDYASFCRIAAADKKGENDDAD